MKKFISRIEKETLWGGIFGFIAIIAILGEMFLGGFDSATIVGGIKDIAGTVVSVMLFFFAVKAIFFKEDTSFHATFENEMKKIETKYTPLLKKAEANGDERRVRKFESKLCYELATNIEALLGGAAGKHANFFEFDISSPDKITFSINKSTFMGASPESFEPLKKEISLKIENGILRRCPEFSEGVARTTNGVEVSFGRVLTTADDARLLAKLVDCVLLLYIAACKK